jgi:hypothetical protein
MSDRPPKRLFGIELKIIQRFLSVIILLFYTRNNRYCPMNFNVSSNFDSGTASIFE